MRNDVNILDSAEIKFKQLNRSKKLKKALIIEDEPFWQITLTRALKNIDSNFEVVVVQDPSQAIQTVLECEIDIILSDQILKGAITGLDIWDHLQNLRSQGQAIIPECPFFLISAVKKQDFFIRLMPFRDQSVPYYIEKQKSLKGLIKQLTIAIRNIK